MREEGQGTLRMVNGVGGQRPRRGGSMETTLSFRNHL